jgi:hypothetical protein
VTYLLMFAGLLWTAASMAVIAASFVLLSGCSDLDLRWGIPAAAGCAAGIGTGGMSMMHALALMTSAAGT